VIQTALYKTNTPTLSIQLHHNQAAHLASSAQFFLFGFQFCFYLMSATILPITMALKLFIQKSAQRGLAGDVEVEDPGYDESKHHAGKKEVEKPVALPKPPRLVARCLRSPGVARLVPLLHELPVAKTYHIACG
jgi:hypothetical protein